MCSFSRLLPLASLLAVACVNDPFDSGEPLTRAEPRASDAGMPDLDETDDLCPPDPPRLGELCPREASERNRCTYKIDECTIDGVLYDAIAEYICFRGTWHEGPTRGPCGGETDAGEPPPVVDAAPMTRDAALNLDGAPPAAARDASLADAGTGGMGRDATAATPETLTAADAPPALAGPDAPDGLTAPDALSAPDALADPDGLAAPDALTASDGAADDAVRDDAVSGG